MLLIIQILKPLILGFFCYHSHQLCTAIQFSHNILGFNCFHMTASLHFNLDICAICILLQFLFNFHQHLPHEKLQQGPFAHITDHQTIHGSMFVSLRLPPSHHPYIHPVACIWQQPKSMAEALNRMPFTNLTNTTSPNVM